MQVCVLRLERDDIRRRLIGCAEFLGMFQLTFVRHPHSTDPISKAVLRSGLIVFGMALAMEKRTRW